MTSKTSSDSASAVPATTDDSTTNFLYNAIKGAVAVYALYHCCATAYEIRMQSINEFGPVIHEFDPYFNFRATEVRKIYGKRGMNRKSLSVSISTMASIKNICDFIRGLCQGNVFNMLKNRLNRFNDLYFLTFRLLFCQTILLLL